MKNETPELKTPLEKFLFWCILASPIIVFVSCTMAMQTKHTAKYDDCLKGKRADGVGLIQADAACSYWDTLKN
jgi:hypothetical protein